MTPEQIRDAVDERLGELWPYIVAAQEQYAGQMGVYFQGLWTHQYPPPGEQITDPDSLDQKPPTKPHTWLDVGWDELAGEVRVRVKIDEYVSPDGSGFVVRMQFAHSGDVWQRSINHGPDDSFGHGWLIDEQE